jgi:hypothetical protein
MRRPVIAIVTGFTRNPELLHLSLAPLRQLKQRGAIDRIVCVTWDKGEIDHCVAPITNMPDVELIRVPEPAVKGSRYQRGVVYQVRNLEAALDHVPDDALVLKTRPDFISDPDLLYRKLNEFDTLCAPSKFAIGDGLGLPASPFRAKIWIPWADANQPFFYEDATFIGLKSDVAKLATPHIADKLSVLDTATNTHGPFAHVIRYGSLFRSEYPVFARYLRDYKYFNNDMAYRGKLVPVLLRESHFWTLAIVHAWILANSFHVDAGRPGQLRFYANHFNEQADWSSLSSLRINPPFNDVEGWRRGVNPTSLTSAVARLYGRLMDDTWQHGLFSEPGPTDITRDKLRAVLKNVSSHGRGELAKQEASFYSALSNMHREYFAQRAA